MCNFVSILCSLFLFLLRILITLYIVLLDTALFLLTHSKNYDRYYLGILLCTFKTRLFILVTQEYQ